MLWSVIPEEVVFDSWEQEFSVIEKTIGSHGVCIRAGSDGFGSVERIMSTNPKDFMNKSLFPGKKIRL